MEARGVRATRLRTSKKDAKEQDGALACTTSGRDGPAHGAAGQQRAAIGPTTLLAQFTLLLAKEGYLVCGDDLDEVAATQLVDALSPRLPPELMGPAVGLRAPAGLRDTQPPTDDTTNTAEAMASGMYAGPAPTAVAMCPAASAAIPVELRLHHSCRSTACGDLSCGLCRYNTVQPCGRSLTSRYLAEDPLRAPCGAPVHVAVSCAAPAGGAAEGAAQPTANPLLKPGTAVEVIVINGDVYDGLTPAPGSCGGAHTPPPFEAVLTACAIDRSAARGPLLRAEAGVALLGASSAGGGGAPMRPRSKGATSSSARRGSGSASDEDGDCDDAATGMEVEAGSQGCVPAPGKAAGAPTAVHDRLVLLPQGGLVSLSGLRCIASSEAVLQAKGARFRLALRAVDAATGAPLPGIGHAISEPFLVATRRMKAALKRDTPTTADDIARLVHIGRATAEKLRRLAAAARAEGIGLRLPASGELDRIETVGQFASLAALAASDAASRAALLGLLRLSAAHWAEAVAHAGAAVPPDGRRRLFAAQTPAGHVGLLFEARFGVLLADEGPCGVVLPSGEELPLRALEARLAPLLPAMRDQAMRQWRLPGHPGWGIYARDGPTLARAPSASGDGAAVASRHSSGRTSPVQVEQEQQEQQEQQQQQQPPQSGVPTPISRAVPTPAQRMQGQSIGLQAPTHVQLHLPLAPAHGPVATDTPGSGVDDALKRGRSETAERRASAMAEARARLLALRRGLPDARAAGADAPAPWEVDPSEAGEGDNDHVALMSMYRRWAEGSLTLPGTSPGVPAFLDASAAAVPAVAATAAAVATPAAGVGVTFMPLDAVAPRDRALLLPTDVEALLGDDEAATVGGAAPAARQSAPLLAQRRSGAEARTARCTVMHSLSDPIGFARTAPGGATMGQLSSSLEGRTPWLLACGRPQGGAGGLCGSLDAADVLCSGLREMSFDLPAAGPH